MTQQMRPTTIGAITEAPQKRRPISLAKTPRGLHPEIVALVRAMARRQAQADFAALRGA